MTGYYDIVLGLIPVSLAGLTALLVLAGVSLSVSIPMASVVTLGLMGHAMFVRAPVDPTPSADASQHATDASSTTTSAYTAD